MLPYLAKGFADVIMVKDPELKLPWITEGGSWDPVSTKNLLGYREPEKWQHDGGVPLHWL